MSESTVPVGTSIVHIPEAGESVECRLVSGRDDYAVGDDGSVWTQVPYPSNKILADGESPPWRSVKPTLCKNGNMIVRFYGKNGKGAYYVHRVVLSAFGGMPPTPQHCAAHSDGDRTNNAASNLRWATRKENERDKLNHGTWNRRGHQLTDDEAREIVRVYCTTDITQQELAVRHGVTNGTICHLLRGKTYRYLNLDLSAVPRKRRKRKR